MKKILLVDDSATILTSISSVLSKDGYQVETARDGVQAFGAISAGSRFDLMITDLNMPNMDGLELIRKVRELANCRFMPILFLTTESQQSKKSEAKAAGATGWLVKPASVEGLLNTVKMVIK